MGYLSPQGASGSSGSGGTNTGGVWPNPVLQTSPGKIFALDQWQGHVLRKLTLSTLTHLPWYGRIQIRRDIPGSLDPRKPHHGAFFDLYVYVANDTVRDINFFQDLISVEYGEKMYLVIFDWLTAHAGAGIVWAVNHYWEPRR